MYNNRRDVPENVYFVTNDELFFFTGTVSSETKRIDFIWRKIREL